MAEIKSQSRNLPRARGIAEVLEEAISVSAGELFFAERGGNAVQIERLEVQPSGLRE